VDSVKPLGSVNRLNPVDAVDAADPEYAVDSVNQLNSVDAVDSVNQLNSVDAVDAAGSVYAVDSVNQLNSADAIDAAGPAYVADSTHFSHSIIKGEKYSTMLPEGTALVLEGGGVRGFYSAGVFEAFMDAGIMFPYIIGVSAGAANALTYVAGQRGRNRMIVENYVGDHRYVSYRNLLRHKSMFGYDFIFKTIPEEHVFWDREVFDSTDIRFLTGATDCSTGHAIWFEKRDISPGFTVTRASCSVPLLSTIVRYNGFELLDGGAATPIPIEKSIEDGNTFHVIILTRNKGYIKTAFRPKSLLKLFYSKYPGLIETLSNRHETYNRQLSICEQLERENKALIIRPLMPLSVGRTATDTEKLLGLYDEGVLEGNQAVESLGLIFDFQSN